MKVPEIADEIVHIVIFLEIHFQYRQGKSAGGREVVALSLEFSRRGHIFRSGGHLRSRWKKSTAKAIKHPRASATAATLSVRPSDGLFKRHFRDVPDRRFCL